jgi:hypothetical protein
MLKIALPVVLLCTLSLFGQPSQPPSPGAGKQSSQNGNAQGKPVQPQPKPSLQGTQASPLWVNITCPACPKTDTDASAYKSDNKPANRRRDPDWWIVGLTGVLAIIAFGQAVLFLRQLKMLRENMADSKVASIAAKVAAEAAMKSVNIATNSERAWILSEGDPNEGFDSWIFTFVFKNFGRSPARVLYKNLWFEVLSKGESLPTKPPYWGKQQDIIHQEWIVNDQPFEIAQFSAYGNPELQKPEVFEAVKAGGKTLWLFGVIRYRDTVSPRIHETRFCYWRGVGKEIGLHMGGPPKYNKCT